MTLSVAPFLYGLPLTVPSVEDIPEDGGPYTLTIKQKLAQLETGVIEPIVASRTCAEFEATEARLLKAYMQEAVQISVLAINNQTSNKVSMDGASSTLCQRIAEDTFLPWSEEQKRDTLFHIESFFRAVAVLAVVAALPPVSQEKSDQDNRIAVDMLGNMFVVEINLHCLVVAIRKKMVVMPEVLSAIIECISRSVHLSVLAQQAYELRSLDDFVLDPMPLGTDDTQLLEMISSTDAIRER